ncbi:protein of unknown function [Legionella micdadei]|uniref:Uncharacterized protein n=1 Tax=Legionella micdadei TaxID=451 RepID=A0A098GG74_LEGMI|nr:protein of unknown function [Legionella micdadei]SCY44036.1 hypothetical protein SAMN02982997_01693 [Legionella micdadei]
MLESGRFETKSYCDGNIPFKVEELDELTVKLKIEGIRRGLLSLWL